MKAHVRWMIRRDMPEVLEIENRCFDNAWTKDDFTRALRHRICIGMVAELPEDVDKYGKIAGYVIYELTRRGLNILNFAVHPDHHRNGYGTQVVDMLKRKLNQGRRKWIQVHVSEHNLPAQLFFQSCGFRCTSIVESHYDSTEEAVHAYRMRYAIDASHAVFVNRISRRETTDADR